MKIRVERTPFEKIELKTMPNINIYAKLESYNFSGSVKARMAYYMLIKAFKNKEIRKDTTIIEATTGNTGIAFSALARQFSLNMIAVMPENQSIERIKLMRAYGAKIVLTPADKGPKGAIAKRNLLKRNTPNAWGPDQFSNHTNIEAHKIGLGIEILRDLRKKRIKPDYLVHGVGTGGTLMGIAETLKTAYPDLQVIAVEPAESPTLSTGKPQTEKHGIQGIGEGFIPAIVDLDKIDNIEKVQTKQAIYEMLSLARNTGISLGISSGANIAAIRQIVKKKQVSNKNFLTIFADGIDRYLSLIE